MRKKNLGQREKENQKNIFWGIDVLSVGAKNSVHIETVIKDLIFIFAFISGNASKSGNIR